MATAPAAAAKSAPKATAAPKLPIWVWEGKTKTGEVKKVGLDARRRPGRSPEGLRYALCPARRRRRNRRYPRHHPQPARAVHREEREAEEQGEERDGVPERGARGRRGRHGGAAALRHPDLREDVQGL